MMPIGSGQQSIALRGVSLRAVLERGAFGLLLWWIIAEAQPGSLIVGLPAVVLAVVVSFWLDTGHDYRVRLWRVPRFVVFFVFHSLVAGLDVARRTLHPRLLVSPVTMDVDIRSLPTGTPRWLLATTLSLLPGTLTVVDAQQDGFLYLHCLDEQGVEEGVARACREVARLFGVPGQAVAQ